MDASELEGIPLFDSLSRTERERIASHADVVDLKAGYRLVEQGRFAHEFFVLLKGSVEVTQDGKHLADMGPGDFFGEVALVEHDRRTASCTATTPISAIVMHQRDFELMRHEMPEVAALIHQAVHERSPRHPD
jgi:CRP-like cAMP-binding protein